MKKTKCIAFHSYKGGTGKTTLASNLVPLLVRKGLRVCLLDLDVYAPSIQSYFGIRPLKWINDYLDSNGEVEEVMQDLTELVNKTNVTLGNVVMQILVIIFLQRANYGWDSRVPRKKRFKN